MPQLTRQPRKHDPGQVAVRKGETLVASSWTAEIYLGSCVFAVILR